MADVSVSYGTSCHLPPTECHRELAKGSGFAGPMTGSKAVAIQKNNLKQRLAWVLHHWAAKIAILANFVKAKVASGRYGSSSEVIREALA